MNELKNTHYADYIKQLHGGNVIDHENGFLAWTIHQDQAHILEIFVANADGQSRAPGVLRSMLKSLEQIGLAQNCVCIVGKVYFLNPMFNSVVKISMGLGFEIGAATPDWIGIVKKIGGNS